MSDTERLAAIGARHFPQAFIPGPGCAYCVVPWPCDAHVLAAIAERAIAHDSQPYPTAWAYEQACAAREKWQQRAIEAEAQIAALWREWAALAGDSR